MDFFKYEVVALVDSEGSSRAMKSSYTNQGYCCGCHYADLHQLTKATWIVKKEELSSAHCPDDPGKTEKRKWIPESEVDR